MAEFARHWIDGAWCESSNGARAVSFDPGTGEALGEFADAGPADAEPAIAAARRVFDRSDWRHGPRARSAVLLELADRLDAARPEVARRLAAENGKLIADCGHEIAGAASELRYYAGLARNIFGRVIELDRGMHAMLAREPVGVVAIIVPWNAPVTLLIRSLAPVLAAGCTAVVKAAPQTALVNAKVFELLASIDGLPPGAVNMLVETGSDVAKLLVGSADVDMISYTGSTRTGKRIMAAAAGTLKKLNLELGGNAPCVVFEDADLDRAVAGIARAALSHAGQVCVAASRVIAHRSIVEDLEERFRKRLSDVRLGLADDPAAELGPLIDRPSRDRVRQLVRDAAADGDVLLEGAEADGALAAGAFLSPSLVHVRSPGSPLLTDEVFGPVLSVQSFTDEDEAISKANDSRFGLAASVWTRDQQRGLRAAAAIRSGSVWLNGHMRLFPEIETGGYRESGIGRLHGVEGLEAFLQTKAVTYELGRPQR
ncbi:MAG: aldehyde dehydrogenase family protein [Gammaproteobacteria bacterium]|nr:aldehyde dehydrogenase family protein [Gammaproteobacteria bacterium]